MKNQIEKLKESENVIKESLKVKEEEYDDLS